MTISRGWSPSVGGPYSLDARLPFFHFRTFPAGFCLVSWSEGLPVTSGSPAS